MDNNNFYGNGQQFVGQQQIAPQVGQPVVTAQPTSVQQMQPVQHSGAMFTQEQVNSIVGNRVNPLNQRINELTAQLQQSQQLSQSYLGELTAYKNRDTAKKCGISDQFLDFAVFEAGKLAVNGKSFEDAIKEYAASNQHLLAVSQTGVQPTPNTTPVGVVGTQVVANPAQNATGQQPVAQNPAQNQPYAQQIAQPAPQTANPTATQPVGQMQFGQQIVQNAQVGATVPTQGIVGSTGFRAAGTPQNVNNIDGDVRTFLKAKGVIK